MSRAYAGLTWLGKRGNSMWAMEGDGWLCNRGEDKRRWGTVLERCDETSRPCFRQVSTDVVLAVPKSTCRPGPVRL